MRGIDIPGESPVPIWPTQLPPVSQVGYDGYQNVVPSMQITSSPEFRPVTVNLPRAYLYSPGNRPPTLPPSSYTYQEQTGRTIYTTEFTGGDAFLDALMVGRVGALGAGAFYAASSRAGIAILTVYGAYNALQRVRDPSLSPGQREDAMREGRGEGESCQAPPYRTLSQSHSPNRVV